MSKPFDVTLKHLLERYPEDWLRLVGVEVSGPVEVADGDVATVSAQADKVFRLHQPTAWLLHLEVQAGYDAALPGRMHLYNTLLGHRHGIPVRSVLLLLRKKASGRGLTGVLHRRDPSGREYLRFRYEIVRVWQLPLERILQSGIGTLPLALLTDEAHPRLPEVVRQLQRHVDREVQPAEATSFWTAAYVLMGLRYPKEVGQRLLREVRGMKESSTYQAIIQEGREQERKQARVQASRELLFRWGMRSLGKPNREVQETIEAIDDIDRLDGLTDRVLEVQSWAELFQE